MRYVCPALLLIATLLVLSALLHQAEAQNPPATALVGYVTRVVDGDTIYVAIGNRIEKVRYIGINTPEIHHPTKGREPYSDAAREANARLVDGRWVQLVLDVQQRDSIGRFLAYVYVGSRFVNAQLVWQGYADAATYPPNVRYAEYFVDLQRQARETRRGLWADPDAVAYYRPRPPEQSQPASGGAGSALPAGNTATRNPAGGPAPATTLPSSVRPLPGATAPSPGTDVNVKGYTIGDGTYVAPYTRSAPRR